jgi:hypothetical protein
MIEYASKLYDLLFMDGARGSPHSRRTTLNLFFLALSFTVHQCFIMFMVL